MTKKSYKVKVKILTRTYTLKYGWLEEGQEIMAESEDAERWCKTFCNYWQSYIAEEVK